MQFLYEGRVCLNGKDLRAWTAARAELQGTFVSAMDYMRHPASAAETPDAQQVNAIDIAKVLLESFVAPPVTKLVFGDDESQSLRRVATIMTTQYTNVVVPLKQFVESQMKLPLVMHDVVKQGLTTLFGLTWLPFSVFVFFCWYEGVGELSVTENSCNCSDFSQPVSLCFFQPWTSNE